MDAMRDQAMAIKIYFDGATLQDMFFRYQNDARICGFTTNPTLMKQAGIAHYEEFAKTVLKKISDRPVSFEVFSDELHEMEEQAKKIASWGDNVYVKIPITNTRGVSTASIIKSLSSCGVKLNITAVFTMDQVKEITQNMDNKTPIIVSLFAGRIANAGVDPVPIVEEAVRHVLDKPRCEILWASTREAFNIIQAEKAGCHIITVTNSLLDAANNFGKSLHDFSLETVKMFYQDAVSAGYEL